MKAKTLLGIVLILILGALLGLGIEALAKAVFSGEALSLFTKSYALGVNALALKASLSGIIGLVASFFIVKAFIKI